MEDSSPSQSSGKARGMPSLSNTRSSTEEVQPLSLEEGSAAAPPARFMMPTLTAPSFKYSPSPVALSVLLVVWSLYLTWVFTTASMVRPLPLKRQMSKHPEVLLLLPGLAMLVYTIVKVIERRNSTQPRPYQRGCRGCTRAAGCQGFAGIVAISICATGRILQVLVPTADECLYFCANNDRCENPRIIGGSVEPMPPYSREGVLQFAGDVFGVVPPVSAQIEWPTASSASATGAVCTSAAI